MELREPKEITLLDGNEQERKFILSKMPAFEGFEIMARYPVSLATSTIPKVADWNTVNELQLKIMKYVAVDINGRPMRLSTQALIDNHTGDWECLAKLLAAEVEYNNSFFRKGIVSNFFEEVVQKMLGKLSEILTSSSGPSSPTTKPPSTN
jgi:hypothetical protein